MPVRLLDEQHASELRAAPLSYTPREGPEGDAPPGYSHLNRSVTLTRRDFDGAARDLFAWRMHSKAGLQVQASDVPLREDTVVLMRWGLAGGQAIEFPAFSRQFIPFSMGLRRDIG